MSIVEVNAVKRWPWRKIVTCVACVLVVIGIAPIAFLLWWGNVHNWDPMTMPLPLEHGVYTSPYFTTDLDKPYYLVVISDRILDGQSASCIEGAKVIDSHACAGVGRTLDMDWQIVNERGIVVQQGRYNGRIFSGEEARLGEYLAKPGSRLKINLRMHEDVQGFNSAHPKLEFQPNPEYGLENAYGAAAFMTWAAIVAGPGIIILLALLSFFLISRLTQKRADAASY